MILSYTIPKCPPKRFESESDTIIVGRRPEPDQRVDLDLEADEYVSRIHSCISRENTAYWVQDLGSVNGTWVNGVEIKEKTLLSPGDTIQIGYTVIVVQMESPPTAEVPEHDSENADTIIFEKDDGLPTPAEPPFLSEMEATAINPDLATPDTAPEPPLVDLEDVTLINPDLAEAGLAGEPETGAGPAPESAPEAEPEPETTIPRGEIIDAADVTIHSLIGSGRDTVDEVLMQGWRQLKAFNDLVQTLGTAEKLDALVDILVKHLQGAIPNALRGAVLLPDEGGELLLKAHWPTGEHSVSMTWVRRAFDNREAFIWAASAEDVPPKDLPASAVYYKVQSAIYVPMMVGGDVLGVMYVDNYYDRDAFSATDFELLKAVAYQVAVFVRDRVLRKDRQRERFLFSRLSRQFPPKIFELMMKKGSRHRIGGERIDPVTILVSDVRGFTALSREMAPDDVVRMLNEMFDAFVPIIFEHDGIVDKYVGDSVLAVFGSPEPDNRQWEKAVRAALAMQRAVHMLGEGRRVRRLPVFQVGISVHTGAVIHGFIGSAEREEYTVIGDTVNCASRYCDGAGPGEVVISKDVYERVYRLVDVQPTTIRSKHADTEPDLEGYIVKGLTEK